MPLRVLDRGLLLLSKLRTISASRAVRPIAGSTAMGVRRIWSETCENASLQWTTGCIPTVPIKAEIGRRKGAHERLELRKYLPPVHQLNLQ